MYERGLTYQLSKILEGLHEMTMGVEKMIRKVPELKTSANDDTASYLAGNLVHTLAWGNANLNVSQFVRSAAEFDREVLR
jgi:hypothetical protein